MRPSHTVCYRYKVTSYAGPGYPYVDMMQFGRMKEDFSDITEGYIWGNWPESEIITGQWIGIPTNPPIMAWVSLPTFTDKFNRNVWKHQCFSINFSTGKVKYFLNGEEKFSEPNLYKDVKDDIDPFSRTFDFLSLGCVYQTTGSKIKSTLSQYTDLQMFSRELSDSEMISYTSCTDFLKGDLLSWENIPWVLTGKRQVSEIEYLDIHTQVCAPQDTSLTLVPFTLKKEPFGEQMCSKLSGKVASYTNKQDLQLIINFLANRKNLNENGCIEKSSDIEGQYTITVGVDGKLLEGKFQNPSAGTPVTYLPWEEGRPWGGLHQCLFISLVVKDRGKYSPEVTSVTIRDEGCSSFDAGCFLCVSDNPATKLYVRGLCPSTKLDTTYMLHTGAEGEPVYLGQHTSVLYYHKQSERWMLIDRMDNESFAWSGEKKKTLLLGKNIFDFSNFQDDCVSPSEERNKLIKLTSCGEGSFTCDDGQCIDIEERCDQNPNCFDQSDEVGCKMLVKSETYKKTIAPFIFQKSTGIVPVTVNVSIEIISLLKFMEVDLEFVLKFQIKSEWFDKRLTYWNLKLSRYANALSMDEKGSIWLPILVFTNTDHNEVTAGDADSEVTITRESDFVRSEPNVVEEINIFDGRTNRLTYERIYTKTFRCDFQLQLYPFDTQKCFVDISTKKLDRQGVAINPLDIEMLGPTVLTQFIITSWSFEFVNTSRSGSGLRMTLVLKRRIVNELLTSYLPTFLILIIVYATNYFKDFFFEAVVTVNLTSLLVLTTLFISVSGSLPKTAYVKMIDIWLIFAQLIPFFEVLLHTYMDTLRIEGPDKEREINHHGKTITVGSDNAVAPSGEKKCIFIHYLTGQFNISGISSPLPGEVDRVPSRSRSLWSGVNKRLVSRDEQEMVEARKEFYKNAENEKDFLKKGEWIGKKAVPFFVFVFCIFYWGYGLSYYILIET